MMIRNFLPPLQYLILDLKVNHRSSLVTYILVHTEMASFSSFLVLISLIGLVLLSGNSFIEGKALKVRTIANQYYIQRLIY
jgi:hypothetical protein